MRIASSPAYPRGNPFGPTTVRSALVGSSGSSILTPCLSQYSTIRRAHFSCAVRFPQWCRRSSLTFGIVAEQPFGGLGDVEPSVSRAIIFGAAIGSLAENFNRRNPMPSHELAGDVFNNIVIVHDRQNNGLRVFAPAAGGRNMVNWPQVPQTLRASVAWSIELNSVSTTVAATQDVIAGSKSG